LSTFGFGYEIDHSKKTVKGHQAHLRLCEPADKPGGGLGGWRVRQTSWVSCRIQSFT